MALKQCITEEPIKMQILGANGTDPVGLSRALGIFIVGREAQERSSVGLSGACAASKQVESKGSSLGLFHPDPDLRSPDQCEGPRGSD